MKNKIPFVVKSVTELNQLLGLPKPRHPLIVVYRYDQITRRDEKLLDYFCPQFYSIAIKKNFKGKVRYGQSFYDFDEGMMSFVGPGQLLAHTGGDNIPEEGFCLMFHPDFIAGHVLAAKIRQYSFFSYELNEALHLSDEEQALVETIIGQIETEYQNPIDTLSQDVMITHIELLLHYSQRFYNRQFITRKPANHELLARVEKVLNTYFSDEMALQEGLPTVQHIAEALHISPNYLSDMLRIATGKSAQGHIQDKIIEKAKELLSTTNLSISEVAYLVGFERPQSLNRLFKKKTNLTPVAFKQGFRFN
ncbi:helix-turn-helix domain-containing protein [Spirosoma panaciterrae]|uniref:helix-turn-helix domain-containing protein n=1 Tax=Spirosoma panaciterrae TaxID=496058 RepID=UPI0005944EEA|nr:AraC family transcriptional regulator [Spirosoma panaciterrae]